MKKSEFEARIAALEARTRAAEASAVAANERAQALEAAAARNALPKDPMIVVVDHLAPSESGKPRVRVRISNTGTEPIVIKPGTEHSFFANEFVRDISGGKRNGFYCRPMTDGVKPIGTQSAEQPAAKPTPVAKPAAAPVASDDDQQF